METTPAPPEGRVGSLSLASPRKEGIFYCLFPASQGGCSNPSSFDPVRLNLQFKRIEYKDLQSEKINTVGMGIANAQLDAAELQIRQNGD